MKKITFAQAMGKDLFGGVFMRKVIFTVFSVFCAVLFSGIALAVSDLPQRQQPIRGIYVQASNTSGPKFAELLDLVNKTDLNSMVIDIKNDSGYLTYTPAKHSKYYPNSFPYIKNPQELIQTLKKHNIYPIARIVVFKDTVLAKSKPGWTFMTASGAWKNSRGDSFTNPFVKEVWEYNTGIAIEAAKLGFKEIQFDYVRFPEKFEQFENGLTYTKINFNSNSSTSTVTSADPAGKDRVRAVTEFVKYAKTKLKPYNVKMSVDTFGNTTVIEEARGIGQNFSDIAQNVDVISSMIYPSHWSSIFGIEKPDLEPYQLVKEYARFEKNRLKTISPPPTSRPWLQDFTAAWLGEGNYKAYGKAEVEDQIRALHSEGIQEFLLWNAANTYSPNVDYTP